MITSAFLVQKTLGKENAKGLLLRKKIVSVGYGEYEDLIISIHFPATQINPMPHSSKRQN